MHLQKVRKSIKEKNLALLVDNAKPKLGKDRFIKAILADAMTAPAAKKKTVLISPERRNISGMSRFLRSTTVAMTDSTEIAETTKKKIESGLLNLNRKLNESRKGVLERPNAR